MTIHLDLSLFYILLRNLCGLPVQILPCAFLCFYPFADRMKINRRKLFCILTAILAVMDFLFILPIVFMEYPSYVQDIICYITLLLLAANFFFIEAYISQKIFVFTVIMNYGCLIYMLVYIPVFLLPSLMNPDRYYYSIPVILSYIIVNAVLFYPMLLLMRRIRWMLNSPVNKQIWKQSTWIPAIYVTAACFAKQLVFLIDDQSFYLFYLCFICAALLFMLTIYYYILSIMETITKSAFVQFQLEKKLEDHRRYVESTDKIHELQHEIKHHINALNLYIKNKDFTGAEMYLDQFSKITSNMPVVAYTPHPLLNSMLSEYKERAEKAETQIIYDISVAGTIKMEDTDLCCLLSNCMDNALEACSKIAPAKRLIRLQIRQNGHFLLFSCENSYNMASLQYKNGILASSKNAKNNFRHGYGISIMNQIASKYNGAFRTTAAPDTFTTTISLCLPA